MKALLNFKEWTREEDMLLINILLNSPSKQIGNAAAEAAKELHRSKFAAFQRAGRLLDPLSEHFVGDKIAAVVRTKYPKTARGNRGIDWTEGMDERLLYLINTSDTLGKGCMRFGLEYDISYSSALSRYKALQLLYALEEEEDYDAE